MKPQNTIVIMSDEHSRAMAGCYGHDLIETPNMDRLAQNGTAFDQAYTPCPVCVPARAAFATGKYNHQVGYWDNADPYEGSVPSWHHRLREAGHEVVSIGKLHFRSSEDDNGFSQEILPMNVIEGKGDLMGLVRSNLPKRGMSWKMARMAGPGESSYTLYDRQIAAETAKWLHDEAPKHTEKPWVLFVSFATPHFPLTAPPEHFYRYYDDPRLPMPKLYNPDERPRHPFLVEYANSFNYDEYFETDDDVYRAVAGYYGLCSFVDEQIGKVLDAVEMTGHTGDTRIVYTSDHGDNLGARGLWGKSTMYEESAGVPLIVSGESIPAGRRCATPVTLLDLYPFIIESAGESGAGMIDAEHPGTSVAVIANGTEPDRTILSEYHGMGSTTGAFMIRNGRYKYIYYVAYSPQLFDLEADPEELTDLAHDPSYAEVVRECDGRLRTIIDPEDADRRAKERQAYLLEKHGGREAVVSRGDLGFSPPPGFQPDLG